MAKKKEASPLALKDWEEKLAKITFQAHKKAFGLVNAQWVDLDLPAKRKWLNVASAAIVERYTQIKKGWEDLGENTEDPEFPDGKA